MNVVACPSCSKHLRYGPHQSGKQVRCPACQTPMMLPGEPAGDPVEPIGQQPTGQHSNGQSLPQSDSPFEGQNSFQPNRYSAPTDLGHPAQPNSGLQQQPHPGYQPQPHPVRPVQQAPLGPSPKLPRGFAVDQSPHHLKLVTPGGMSQFGALGFVALSMVVLALMAFPFILSMILGPNILSKFLGFVVSPLSILAFIYLIIASIMNRRVVEVTHDHIKVKFEGPVPCPSFATTLSAHSVQQIYVVRRTYAKRINHGMDSVAEVASTALAVHDGIQNGWHYHTYHVFAVRNNGWRKELIGGDIGPKGARFVEKSVERFLGIPDQPVASTWYQSFFYRENTLDELSKNYSGGGLRAKCMYLPIAYSAFATFALLVFMMIAIAILLLAATANNINDRMARDGEDTNPIQDLAFNDSILLEDDFEDGAFSPLWKNDSSKELIVTESDGVVKISSQSPSRSSIYRRNKATIKLTEKFAARSFTAEIEVLSSSLGKTNLGNWNFGFSAVGAKKSVGAMFSSNRYLFIYDRKVKSETTKLFGDEATNWYRWRIEYDAPTQNAAMFIGDQQVGETLAVDFGDSLTFEFYVACEPREGIEVSFDNFRVKFNEGQNAAVPNKTVPIQDTKPRTTEKLETSDSTLVEDDFEDGDIAPLWTSTANQGLNVNESDGVVKISGMVPRHPERYVSATMDLSEKFAARSFTAELDVLASSGTFEGAKHRQRGFSFFAFGTNKRNVGVQYWANQYKIAYDLGQGQKRKYSPSNGDERTKWYRWRIEYDAFSKSASVFVDDRQIGDTVTIDLGDSVTFNIRVTSIPGTRIEGSFDKFRVRFHENQNPAFQEKTAQKQGAKSTSHSSDLANKGNVGKGDIGEQPQPETGGFVFPDPEDPNSLSVWGHEKGLRIGLAPAPGPQGLIRIYSTALGQKYPQVVNFISIEPSVFGQAGRDQSVSQQSRDRPGEAGLSFWASNTREPTPRNSKPVSGVVDEEKGTLRLYVHTEPFQNGAVPIIECVFDRKQPNEVKFITHAARNSRPIQWCTLSATMGTYGLLNQVKLKNGPLAARSLLAPRQKDKLGFFNWVEWRSHQLPKTRDGRYLVEFSSDAKFDKLKYQSNTPKERQYQGKSATHYWMSESDSNPVAAANGRDTYWGTNVPIPVGPSFEYVELRIPFKEGRGLWFGVRPDNQKAESW